MLLTGDEIFQSQTKQTSMHFGPLTNLIGSRRFHNNQEMLQCCSQTVPKATARLYGDGIFKLAPRRDKFIAVARDYIEK
jgi:hypothetical protein